MTSNKELDQKEKRKGRDYTGAQDHEPNRPPPSFPPSFLSLEPSPYAFSFHGPARLSFITSLLSLSFFLGPAQLGTYLDLAPFSLSNHVDVM